MRRAEEAGARKDAIERAAGAALSVIGGSVRTMDIMLGG